jgi:APA family basic amino acid/polyamine antiporter
VGTIVVAVVLVADLRGAIGFSSFAVLTYYAIANASAWTLPHDLRRWPRPLAALGVVGCLVLAFTLPSASVVGGLVLLAVGAIVWIVRARKGTDYQSSPAA